ncbi:MAG: HAD-IIA family hydrolase [Chloroflexota bacterium]
MQTVAPQSIPVRALILDMDGVLWRGSQPIGDLPAIFAAIERLGLRVVLATNNATLTVTQYQQKLAQFGVQLEAWQIINSPTATAAYLKRRYPEGGPVYVVGELGLVEAMEQQGFHLTPDGEQPLAVVAGLDRGMTYAKIDWATRYIRAGALFVGTNPDVTFPAPYGLAPGAGAVLAAIQAATDVRPIIVGKPEPEMYRVALERLGCSAAETLVVGDRLDTDIAGAQALGCPTALVLTGISTEPEARQAAQPPGLIAADLASVIQHLQGGTP